METKCCYVSFLVFFLSILAFGARRIRVISPYGVNVGTYNVHEKRAKYATPKTSTGITSSQSETQKQLDDENSSSMKDWDSNEGDSLSGDAVFDDAAWEGSPLAASKVVNGQTLYRVPTFMIIGVQKGGTSSLFRNLQKHPLVGKQDKKEMHFFSNDITPTSNSRKVMEKYTSKLLRYSTSLTDTERDSALQQMGQMSMNNETSIYLPFMTVDATPSYMFPWHVPRLVRQICPWVKLIVSLRDPIKRADSAFRMWTTRGRYGTNMTFEDLLSWDMEEMKQAGVLNNSNLSETASFKMPEAFYGSNRENEAWETYLNIRSRFNDASAARGMYAIQVRNWLRHFPRESFLFLKFEDLLVENGTQDRYEKVLRFLGLPQHVLDVGKHQSGAHRPILNETIARLKDFYSPYNRQLADLLGGDWRDAW